MRLHSGIVDAQEFGCAGHSVNIEVLTLGSLFVHELKYGIGRVRVLEDCAGDQTFPTFFILGLDMYLQVCRYSAHSHNQKYLQIHVKPQNEKSWKGFSKGKKGMTNQAGQRGIFANRLSRTIISG